MQKQESESRKSETPAGPVAQPKPDKPPALEIKPEIKQPAPADVAQAPPQREGKQVEPVRKEQEPVKAESAPDAKETKHTEGPADVQKERPVASVEPEPQAPAAIAKEAEPETPTPAQDLISQKDVPDGKVRLIVYDFSAVKHMEVVSLILADALREELFKIGPFVLVSRENIAQVMDELKLQQSGLVDEKQAVRIGGWMAANEMVTGKLAELGKIYVLSATRTDISTLKALGMGSVKCPVGREEDLLSGIPEIARKLAGMR
jgi:hypothetical protein